MKNPLIANESMQEHIVSGDEKRRILPPRKVRKIVADCCQQQHRAVKSSYERKGSQRSHVRFKLFL